VLAIAPPGPWNYTCPQITVHTVTPCLSLSLCLFVRPSRIANNLRTQRPRMPNCGKKVPTFDATRLPVSRSKGQSSRSPGPLMLTHIVRHIFRMPRPTNFKLGVQTDPHQRQTPWPPRLIKVNVTRSHGISDPCGLY